MNRTLLFWLLAFVACRAGPAPATESERSPTAGSPPLAWKSNPTSGVDVVAGDTLVVRTGPHTVLWPTQIAPLHPPYRISATLHKREGRLHEGYGLLFGGVALDGPEAAQRYSYFLVRGDGSFLIKRRIGEQTPEVRAWTSTPAVHRDVGERGEPNTLTVQVTFSEVVFSVNGSEVARLPATEVDTAGIAGLRIAHDVEVRVWDWHTETDAEAQQT